MNKEEMKKVVTERIAAKLTKDILERPTTQPNTAVTASLATLNSKAYVYRAHYFNQINGSRAFGNGFEDYEYNMGEIAQMEDTESYAAISFIKHTELCMKSGYHISSNADEYVKHVNQRLFEIYVNTGISTFELVKNIVRDIVKYSNAYIVLRTDPERTSGKSYKFRGRDLDPIAGMYLVDPPSMTLSRDRKGNVKKYKQRIGGNYNTEGGDGYVEFWPHEVIHLFINRKEGHAYGTPSFIGAIEDVRSLRRIEEMVEMLISSHIFPLFHYIVGTEDLPGTDDEVKLVRDRMESMPTEGSLVTSERHTIKVIGSEGKALDVMPYMEYFEKRVLSGLFISEISVGRGNTANKSTAASLDQSLIDRCAAINQVIGDQITHKLLIHFVLDGKMKLGYDSMPEFIFNNIDDEAVRAKENHALNMYQSNLMTEDEARDSIDRKPLTEQDAGKRHVNTVDIHRAEKEGQIQAKYAPKVTATGAKKSSSSAAKGTTKQKTKPTNQHGTKATKTKRTANNFLEDIICDSFETIKTAINMHINIGTDNEFAKTMFMASTCKIISAIITDSTSEDKVLDQAKTEPIILSNIKKELSSSILDAQNSIGTDKALDKISMLEDKFIDFIITHCNNTEDLNGDSAVYTG